MSRREARIERRNEKQLKAQAKSARLVEVVHVDAVPRKAFTPTADKSPRTVENPASIMQMRMEYQIVKYSDRDGVWSWGQQRNWCDNHAPGADNCLIRSTMIEMSGLYWYEILAHTTGGKERHKKHHEQDWGSLCEEARNRWLDIGRLEDELFRFRVGGKQRIWGFRTGHIFNVVWWDAEHQIYPVE